MRLAAFLMIAVLAAGSAAADGREGGRKYGSRKPAADTAAAAVVEAVPEAAPRPAMEEHEANIYRFGTTYASLPGAGAMACESSCRADAQCRAWSHINAFEESPARCELKRATGKREENLAAISGIVMRERIALPMPTPVSTGTLDGAPVVTTTRTYVAASASSVTAPSVVDATPAGTNVAASSTIITSVPTPLGSSPGITYTSPATGPVLASSPTPLGASPSVTYAPSTTTTTSVVTRYPVAAPDAATTTPAPTPYYPSTSAAPTGSSSYYPERPRVLLPAQKPATETPAQ